MAKQVFVFGSNAAGVHGAGAAKTAYEKHGARFGASYGHVGDSFAIPTKDVYMETLPLDQIRSYVEGFLAYARDHSRSTHLLKFKVTRIGCGLAGYADSDIAPMFVNAPANCKFDEAWAPYLPTAQFWGTI